MRAGCRSGKRRDLTPAPMHIHASTHPRSLTLAVIRWLHRKLNIPAEVLIGETVTV